MKCALCGGQLEKKTVEEEVLWGKNRVVVKVPAEACKNCHERYYAGGVVDKLIDLRDQLEKKKVKLHEVGKVFEASGF